ncbi:hypothetical protein [Winogradskyella sp.]|uniref:hypothetical protein n=1 Tax=Winogradskyella sp. TaxID=1883156 RepID=UPI0025FBF5E7|nr:hypothetical protein [Winogradskyella sp.]
MDQIKPKLKIVNLLFTLLVIISFLSCGDGISKQPVTAAGFEAIELELKSKFGDDAYYTDLTITYNESIGNIIGVTVTENPESLQMGQWNLTQNTWKQNQDISIEVPQGSKATDFMFQLDDKINLSTLGELAEISTKKLTVEKNLENSVLSMAFVKFPKNGDISKTEYTVMLRPETGGTTFTFRYNLNGELIKMNY